MARWHQKDHDRLEKVGKMRKRSTKTRRSPTQAEVAEGFERPEDEWELGGQTGAFAARVVEVHKRYCFVSTETTRGAVKTNDVWLATTARKFLVANRAERNFVAVGDRVLCTPAPEQATGNPTDLPQCVIQFLAPRRAKIARLDPHRPGLEHVLATNMDQVMIVASYLNPPVKWGLIDRYLVLAETEGVPAIIVLNKQDLLDAAEDQEWADHCRAMVETYRGLGYPTFSVVANAEGAAETEQIKEIKRLFDGKVTLLSGHSGVGKSSVINLFDPELVQVVEPDEDIFYKGRHTTTFASFIKLGTGGYCIDTPGIRSFTFPEKSAIELSHCFVEMRPLLGQCKFRECRHLDEPDCVVRAAVEAGRITRWRYKSYLGILLGATGREGRVRDLPLDE
jgi:ribosome biogenesis GTPase